MSDHVTDTVAGFWLPVIGHGFVSGQVKQDLWWTKWHWGKFSLSTLVSLANFHSTNCSTSLIILSSMLHGLDNNSHIYE
jgi:hypothetical protein